MRRLLWISPVCAWLACQAATPEPAAPAPAPSASAPTTTGELDGVVAEAVRDRAEPIAAAVVSIADQRVLALGRHRGADPIRDAFRPGSSVKPLLAWIAARHGVLEAGERVGCAGRYPNIEGLSCFATHGERGLAEAIAVSCNVYFYDLGRRLGLDRVRSGFAELGFGKAPGLLASASSSTAEGPARAAELETWAAVVGIGHGPFEATVLQLAEAYAKLARGLTDSRVDREIAEGLSLVVRGAEGTGHGARVDGLEVAGKTGSADAARFGEQPAEDTKENGWFVGFAPASKPEVVVAVLVRKGGPGGGLAAETAGRIFRGWHAQRTSADKSN